VSGIHKAIGFALDNLDQAVRTFVLYRVYRMLSTIENLPYKLPYVEIQVVIQSSDHLNTKQRTEISQFFLIIAIADYHMLRADSLSKLIHSTTIREHLKT